MTLENQKIIFSSPANLPTTYGIFTIVSFKIEGHSDDHLFVKMGDLESKENVLMRVHSECLTGDVFTSLKCDCGEQLSASMKMISEKKEGVVIYLKQEGRGIGLFNKVNAYSLQDIGHDTIASNHLLGFATDLRKFDLVKDVVEYLGLKSINLLTNNPEKIESITKATGRVVNITPLITKPNKHNSDYLQVKREFLDHRL
ncbi:GTP cyclohydrolase II [Fluviicola taffensis]|uniref:GTP cyclohydrolase II n=1 Tax=Fluviicola taffensis TaxID=191579 RepID=UPI003137AB81